MGRSGGGGFGGGGFSGGFSGGGRMSGGFSGGSSFGGGRSSIPSSSFGGGSMFDNGYSGGFGGSGFWGGLLLGQLLGESRSAGDNPPPPTGQPINPQGTTPVGTQKSGGSCLVMIVVLVAAAIFVMALSAILDMDGCASDLAGGSVHSSTVEREALPSGMVIETQYFDDEDGDWIGDPKMLERGMRQFYMETGVQPYLHILPNGSQSTVNALTQIAESEYGELFQDEAHFLVVFCDNERGGFGVGYCIGSAAKTIMDSEAIQIFQDYLDRYYDDYSISESEMFAETYIDTADRIMTTDAERNMPVIIALIVGVVVVIVIAGVSVIVRRRARTREAELKHQQEVLSTPLEKFDDDDVEETARKYEQGRAAVSGDQSPVQANDQDPRDYQKFGDTELEDLERKYASGNATGSNNGGNANSTNRQQ